MAKYHYDLTHAEIIMKDVPVYDAATIAAGEFIMLGTTDPDSGTDESRSFVTAYSGTPANSCIDALGVSLETVTTASSVSVAAGYSTTTGPCYVKAIINPFAVYLTEQSFAAADDVAITSTSTTTVTIASMEDDLDGCWVYFPLTKAGVKGSLRLLTASASGSATMDTALVTTGDGSDTCCLIVPPYQYSLNLEATAIKVSSGNMQSQLNEATNIRVVQTYIDRDQGLEIMKPSVHYNLDNLHLVKGGNGPKVYYDLLLKDHIFGVQE
jgi:hypothetical protein